MLVQEFDMMGIASTSGLDFNTDSLGWFGVSWLGSKKLIADASVTRRHDSPGVQLFCGKLGISAFAFLGTVLQFLISHDPDKYIVFDIPVVLES